MEYARSFKPHKFIKPFRFLICSRKLKEFFKYSLKSNLTILLIILAISGCDFKDQHLKVENGFMDLSVWSFKKDGVVKLNGEWEFYWKQFKSPEDTFTNNQAKYLNIPGGWKDHAFYGENLEGYGYGTYRLVLHANSELEFAGLRVPPISTAYKLWINGKSYSHFGRVGKNQEEYNSQYCPNITYFTVDKPEIEILIQVANFMHTNGGIKQPLILGTANQIKNIRDNNLAKELFVFSCLFILSILQIEKYHIRKKDKFLFYLGLFTLLISLRSLLSGEMYLLQLVKNINHELTIKLECLSISLSTLLFHLFLLELFPSKENAKIKKIFIVFSSLFSFFVIVSPIRIYNKCLGVLHTVIIFSAGYFISYLLYRIIRSKERFSLLLVGSLFFVITVINDILYYYALTSTGSLTSVGLLFFLVTCYLTVYKQYRRSYYGTNEITKYNTNWDKTQAQNNKIFFAESIVEYSKSLTSNIELNEVLKLLLVKLKSFIFFNSGIVVLREGETFKVISSVGCLSPDIDGLLIKELSDDQLIKSIMEGRQPLVLGNLGKKLPYPCIFRNDEEEKSFLAVPIVKNDKVLGIVVLKSKQENAYTDYDAEIVYNFLAQSGIAIENAKLFAEVKKLAVEDELTKIYNRRYFFELAEREFKLHKRYKELKLLSVVMLDIDDFKNINDTYGHYAGDKVLKIVAKKCKESLRETDLIGRYGGEEFAILLPHTEKQEAAIVVERLRKSIADCRIPYGDRIISITVSIGLAVMDERMQTLDQLMIKADEALYIAKSNGKNCIISL